MSRALRIAACALLAALAAAPPPPARAQDSLEAQKRQELEEIRRQAQEKRAAAGKLKGQESHALGALHRTERELNLTRRRLRALQQRHQTLDQQLEVTRANLDRSVQTLAQQRGRLAQRLRRMYEYGPARELEYLLSTRSFADLMERWDFLQMVAEQDRLLLESVRAEKQQVEDNQQALEGHLRDVSRTEKRATKESAKLASLQAQRAGTVKQIQTQREAYEQAAAELERTARAIQGLLADLERRRREETAKARTEGRNPQPYSGDFARGEGALDWPARGTVIGHFGLEAHPRFGTQIRNDGIDIAVPVGTPVHAVAKGRVDFANDDYEGMGGMVVLNHGDGYYTLYGHLSDVEVHSGQEVLPGQEIGRSGETGSLKGPVLHFEVRKGSAALNPEGWLR